MDAPRHRRLRRAAVGIGMLWLVAVVALLVAARADAVAGRAAAQRATGSLTSSRSLDDLATASRRFGRAHHHLANPVLWPLRPLPVVGRQLASARALAAAAADLAGQGHAAGVAAREALDTAAGGGPQGRVTAVVAARHALDGLPGRLLADDLGPRRGLVGPLARARARIDGVRRSTAGGVVSLQTALDALGRAVAGPRHYLVLAANNAEMRGGSGMLLSGATLTLDGGRLTLSPAIPTGDLVVPAGAVTAEGDLGARWGWTGYPTDVRNLMLSPRFDASAPLAARMWEAAGGAHVDAVLAVDVAALARLVAVTGPVAADGGLLTADNATEVLLHKQYLPGGVFAERHDVLADLAAAVVRRLDGPGLDLPALLDGLGATATGRHLLAWSSLPDEQQAIRAAGIDGGLGADSLAVSLLNRGETKTDAFVTVSSTLVAAPTADGGATTFALSVTMRNRVPAGQPPIVAGPLVGGLAYGDHLAILAVNLPGAARNGRIDGVAALAAAGADGPTRVVATQLVVPAGADRTMVVRWEEPGRHGQLSLEPSARIPDGHLSFRGRAFRDDRRERIAW